MKAPEEVVEQAVQRSLHCSDEKISLAVLTDLHEEGWSVCRLSTYSGVEGAQVTEIWEPKT